MQILISDTYDDIEAYIAEHAPGARLLEAITAELDAAYHTVWLHGNTVFHAWAYPGEDTWHLGKEPAREALRWLEDQLVLVIDRFTNPSLYSEDPRGPRLVERDEAVMKEYYDVELAAWGCPGDPVATDRRIVGRIAAARAEVARLSSLRAHHLRRAWQGDGDRGWQTRAAQSLGISPQAITKILAADDRRASARRRAARQDHTDGYLFDDGVRQISARVLRNIAAGTITVVELARGGHDPGSGAGPEHTDAAPRPR